jgi:uncharacterized membrane protein HdeD (DUF308 family)
MSAVELGQARRIARFLWTLTGAVLAILIGAFLVWRPFAGLITPTMALAIFFAAHGVVQILASLEHRQLFARSWLWTATSGIADLILAGVIIVGWPGSVVAWALGKPIISKYRMRCFVGASALALSKGVLTVSLNFCA